MVQNSASSQIGPPARHTQIAESNQISIDHKLVFVKPTGNGKTSEENTTSTPVYVGAGGLLTLLPNTNRDMFRGETTEEGTK